MALALDLTRMIPSLPYKLDRIIDLDLFVMMATREAIKETVLHASAPHAPYVSTAKGVHHHPRSEHLTSYFECLHTSAALAADPAETPASKIIEGLSGEVTVISYAARVERLGLETSTSAGRMRALSLPKPPPASKQTDRMPGDMPCGLHCATDYGNWSHCPHACR